MLTIPHIDGPGRCDIPVVGESHYQTALTRIAGPHVRDGRRVECLAVLYIEPNNKFDPNAVRVEIDGSVVGYMPREIAASIRNALLRAGLRVGDRAGCDAIIAGGRPGESYGVWLDLDVDYDQDDLGPPPTPTPPAKRPWWKFGK